MATIYLRHNVHGTKVAVSELEAKYDESKGWVRYEVGALQMPKHQEVEPLQAEETDAPETIESLRERWSRKFGKEPDKRWGRNRLSYEVGK